MHIVYVTPELNYDNGPQGGLGTFVANIAKIMANNGNTVDILLVTSKPESEYFDDRICVHNIYVEMDLWEDIDFIARESAENQMLASELRIEILNSIKSVKVREKLDEIHSKDSIDIIHFSNHGAFSRFIRNDIPYVIRVSGFMNIIKGGGSIPYGNLTYHGNKLLPRDKTELKELKRCKNIIVPSNLFSDILNNELGLFSKVLESPFLLEKKGWDYSVYDQWLKDKKYVLFFGTCSYLKGIHVIGDLVENYLKNHSNSFFVICGKDTMITVKGKSRISAIEYVKEKAGAYSERVIYLDALQRNSLYPIIEKSDCCILPSRIENLSNACIEAMAMKKIVIATNGASYEQLIINGENGFLCERDNAKSFYEKLNYVLEMSEKKRNSMSSMAYERIKKLSPNVIYKEYYEYYSNVIEGVADNSVVKAKE